MMPILRERVCLVKPPGQHVLSRAAKLMFSPTGNYIFLVLYTPNPKRGKKTKKPLSRKRIGKISKS